MHKAVSKPCRRVRNVQLVGFDFQVQLHVNISDSPSSWYSIRARALRIYKYVGKQVMSKARQLVYMSGYMQPSVMF